LRDRGSSNIQIALIDLTNRGEIVLDRFLGSGSTLIAAEKTGRVCCGVELDPLYVDVIIRRYEAATSTSAILADTGEPFASLAARKRNDEDDARQSRNAVSEVAFIVPNTAPNVVGRSRVRNVSLVRTPKAPPPPPFTAQNKSEWLQGFTKRTRPSAVTISDCRRLPAPWPYFFEKLPKPPP
jgi:hypothetical protein